MPHLVDAEAQDVEDVGIDARDGAAAGGGEGGVERRAPAQDAGREIVGEAAVARIAERLALAGDGVGERRAGTHARQRPERRHTGRGGVSQPRRAARARRPALPRRAAGRAARGFALTPRPGR